MVTTKRSQRPLAFSNTIYSSPAQHCGYAESTLHLAAAGRSSRSSKFRSPSLASPALPDNIGFDSLLRRDTDNDSIVIPVLPPNAVRKCCGGSHCSLKPVTTAAISAPPTITIYDTSSTSLLYDANTNPLMPSSNDGSNQSGKYFKIWRSSHLRRPSLVPLIQQTRDRNRNRNNLPQPSFIMKPVSEAEYARHYAKDDQGRYIGTQAPASDCILRYSRDCRRWRTGIENQPSALVWRNEINA